MIADEMPEYFSDRSAARKAVERVLRETVQEPAEDLRKLELDRLDQMWRAAQEVLERAHVAVSVGKVVRHKVPELDADGQPIIDPETGNPMTKVVEVVDDSPVLQALDRLLKIQERRAKLLGLDAPTKSRVEVVTADLIEAEIQRLEQEIAMREAENARGESQV